MTDTTNTQNVSTQNVSTQNVSTQNVSTKEFTDALRSAAAISLSEIDAVPKWREDDAGVLDLSHVHGVVAGFQSLLLSAATEIDALTDTIVGMQPNLMTGPHTVSYERGAGPTDDTLVVYKVIRQFAGFEQNTPPPSAQIQDILDEKAQETLNLFCDRPLGVGPKFKLGDKVYKSKGSHWSGTIVGTFSSILTPEGYCVEGSDNYGGERMYPASALERSEL